MSVYVSDQVGFDLAEASDAAADPASQVALCVFICVCVRSCVFVAKML